MGMDFPDIATPMWTVSTNVRLRLILKSLPMALCLMSMATLLFHTSLPPEPLLVSPPLFTTRIRFLFIHKNNLSLWSKILSCLWVTIALAKWSHLEFVRQYFSHMTKYIVGTLQNNSGLWPICECLLHKLTILSYACASAQHWFFLASLCSVKILAKYPWLFLRILSI
jgi:hypothetical protein